MRTVGCVSDSDGVSPLGRLLNDLNQRGLSWRRMELEAYRHGHNYSSSAFHQVARDERRRPLDRKAAEAIAAGTGQTTAHILDLDAQRWRGHSLSQDMAADDDPYELLRRAVARKADRDSAYRAARAVIDTFEDAG